MTRTPPHSREAEESVLGAVLLSPDAAATVLDSLDPADFYVPAHQSIYEAMRRLSGNGEPLDPVTLSEELRKTGELEKVGGAPYLTRLLDVVPVTSNVEHYVSIVAGHSQRRDLIRAGSAISQISYDLDLDPDHLTARAAELVAGTANGRPAGDGLRLAVASAIKPEAVEWLWDGRIPLGLLSLCVGPAGRGKTTLLCDIAARVSRGQLGRAPGSVIIATSEDSIAHTLVPRLMAAGADLDRVQFVTIVIEGIEVGLTLPDDLGKLEEAVTGIGAELLVLDPVVGHLSGDIDSHKDHSVRRALGPLAMLADRTGAAVVGIGHLNKSPSSDVLHRLGGSVGFGAAARSVLLFAEDPEAGEESPERLLVHGKCNVGPHAVGLRFRIEARTVTTDDGDIATSGLAWLGEDPRARVSALLASGQPDTDRTERDTARDVILDALSDSERRWSDLAELVKDEGVSEATARRARAELKRVGLIDTHKAGMDGGWWWFACSELAHDMLTTPNLPTSKTVDKFGSDEQVRNDPSGPESETIGIVAEPLDLTNDLDPEEIAR